MTDRKTFDSIVGPEESRRLFGALQRGASRRDVLAMLMAGGMQAASGRQPRDAGRHGAGADAAQGRPHHGGGERLGRERHARPGQAGQPHRLLPRLHVLQRADRARRQPDAAPPTGRGVHHPGRQDLGVQAAQGRDLPRRQAADARRRGVLDHAAQGPGDHIAGQGAGRPDRVGHRQRPRGGDDPPELSQRRPAGDPGRLPLPHRQGRHHRLQRRHRHRPLQGQGVQARRALRRRAQRELLEAEPPVPGRDRARRHHRRVGARQRAAGRPAGPDPGGLPALGRPRHRRRQVRGLRDQVGLVHQPDHAARQQPGQQPGLRAGHEVPVQPRAAAQVDPARPRGGGQRPAHRRGQPLLLQGPAAAPLRPREGQVAPAKGQPGQRRRSRWWPRRRRPTRWRWPW